MQPKIYSLDKHLIPFERIDRHAYYVIEKLRQAGFVAYLVGGSVRDLLLNIRPKDFDISTSARPDQIKKLFRNCILIGKRFRLAHIRFEKKILEVSTFRAGDVEADTLIVRDNVWGTEEQDVLRRDFTINGLFYDPETQTIIDYVGGFTDIQNKILRAIGNPELRFIQDPVRMIRLIKFRARLHFDIEKNTHDALFLCKAEITKSSPARIFEELMRMLESSYAKHFFTLLNDYGLLINLLPMLSNALEEKESRILNYLDEIDNIHKKNPKEKLARSLLLCSLLFPLLESRLSSKYLEENKKIHLGIIVEEAKELIGDLFSPFFRLSKKIKANLISILANQYRFVPVYRSRWSRKLRIPKDPYFSQAITFLKIRSAIDDHLQMIYSRWAQEHEKKILLSNKKRKNDASYKKRYF